MTPAIIKDVEQAVANICTALKISPLHHTAAYASIVERALDFFVEKHKEKEATKKPVTGGTK